MEVDRRDDRKIYRGNIMIINLWHSLCLKLRQLCWKSRFPSKHEGWLETNSWRCNGGARVCHWSYVDGCMVLYYTGSTYFTGYTYRGSTKRGAPGNRFRQFFLNEGSKVSEAPSWADKEPCLTLFNQHVQPLVYKQH